MVLDAVVFTILVNSYQTSKEGGGSQFICIFFFISIPQHLRQISTTFHNFFYIKRSYFLGGLIKIWLRSDDWFSRFTHKKNLFTKPLTKTKLALR